jgi:hypothetical protein
MKKNYKIICRLLFLSLTWPLCAVRAQDDSVATKELLSLKYFNDNNSMQYLIVDDKIKKGTKTEPVINRAFQFYLDSVSDQRLIGKTTTDMTGKGKSFIPVSLKEAWDASPNHKFIAVPDDKGTDAANEIEITKAKILIDTSSESGARNMVVRVMKYENNDWLPASDVEIKVGIRRLGGILSAGDEETYTTDSTGTVTVEFKKDSLPGDAAGNIFLAAKVEDNDSYGNLFVERKVPWGIVRNADSNFFDQRKLWSTNFKTPLWLLSMAFFIVGGVWGTIIYLVTRIVKIKKLGTT